MSRKKGVAARLEFYREALDQVRRDSPQLPLTPMLFWEDSWHDAAGPPPALSKAAEFFGLHLGKPAERDLLLHILAEAVFGGQKGRPRAIGGKWDVPMLIKLAVDCNKVKEDLPGISDSKAVGVIKNRYRDRYKYATAEMMRQRLGSARRWLENENRLRADKGVAPLTSQLTRPILTVE